MAFRLAPAEGEDGKEKPRVYDEYDVMWRIREFRWMLPAYTFPEDCKCVLLEWFLDMGSTVYPIP